MHYAFWHALSCEVREKVDLFEGVNLQLLQVR